MPSFRSRAEAARSRFAHRRKEAPLTHARLPAAPLRRVLLRLRDAESLSWEELADRAGLSSRHLFRLLAARTVSELVADRISCRIGLHPALLWPKEWFRQEHPRRRGSSNAKEAV